MHLNLLWPFSENWLGTVSCELKLACSVNWTDVFMNKMPTVSITAAFHSHGRTLKPVVGGIHNRAVMLLFIH